VFPKEKRRPYVWKKSTNPKSNLPIKVFGQIKLFSPGSYQRLDLFIKVLRVLCPNLTDSSILQKKRHNSSISYGKMVFKFCPS
jgi:hypothetical protein